MSKMRIKVGSDGLEELYELRLVHSGYFIIVIISAQIAFGFVAFRRFSSFWVIIEHALIKYSKGII